MFSEREIMEIISYVREKIPVSYSVEQKDLVYDKKNIYYKIYKYIMDLRKKVEEK